MGGKLTKAKRGKRRWIGLKLSPTFTTRSVLEQTLQTIGHEINVSKPIRLYDFSPSKEHELSGQAIVLLGLKYSNNFREFLSMNPQYGIESLTTSGKIRLVRERLGLSKAKMQK
jgi:hypothetical protein